MSAPARILVVDDTEANRDLLVRRIEREGHTTAQAANGRIALELLRREPFDLVLLDIMMPEMDGFELLEIIKADAALKHLPVILISALDDEENIVRGIRMGADDHLPKPFNRHILKARVEASLARKRLHDREQLHARALEREMDIARSIQAGFLPASLPQAAGWELATWFEPARQVGGDFYDAFTLPGGRFAVVVADVCDKGVGAALYMAIFRSLTRALAEQALPDAADLRAPLCALVQHVNDYVARTHAGANMFATLCLIVFDPASGAATWVNGGHEPPLVCGPDGVRADLQPTGPAVGMLPGMPFHAAGTTIRPGETVLLFTDGIPDARDAAGAPLTVAALRQLAARPSVSADAMLARVQDAVRRHAGATPAFDDITAVAVHRQLQAAPGR